MAKSFMTSSEVIALLRKMQGSRTNLAFAAQLGINNTHLGEIYKGRRSVGPTVAAVLGLTPEIIYRKAA